MNSERMTEKPEFNEYNFVIFGNEGRGKTQILLWIKTS